MPLDLASSKNILGDFEGRSRSWDCRRYRNIKRHQLCETEADIAGPFYGLPSHSQPLLLLKVKGGVKVDRASGLTR